MAIVAIFSLFLFIFGFHFETIQVPLFCFCFCFFLIGCESNQKYDSKNVIYVSVYILFVLFSSFILNTKEAKQNEIVYSILSQCSMMQWGEGGGIVRSVYFFSSVM